MTYEDEMTALENKVDELVCHRIKASLRLLNEKDKYENKVRKALIRTHDWFFHPNDWIDKK